MKCPENDCDLKVAEGKAYCDTHKRFISEKPQFPLHHILHVIDKEQ